MNSNSLLFLIVSVLLALFGVKGANGIQCYECSGTYGNTIMNVCRAGHIGERKNCSSEVKNCYKSRTTEAVPKLARRCGTTKKVQSICQEVNIGSNSQIICHCDDVNLCNSVHRITMHPCKLIFPGLIMLYNIIL